MQSHVRPFLASIVSAVLLAATAASQEPHARRVPGAALSPATMDGTFKVYADAGEPAHWFVAERLQDWLADLGIAVTLEPIENVVVRNANQIVLGDPAGHPKVAEVANRHGMTTQGLGAEGYTLHSIANPYPNLAWRVVVLASSSTGVLRGVSTLCREVFQDAAGNWKLPELRIRDFPDTGWRAYQYQLPAVGSSVASWGSAAREHLDEVARLGVNRLYLRWQDWWRMDDPTPDAQFDGTRGDALAEEVFGYARALGIEPIPVIAPVPYELAQTHGQWREGLLIREEEFVATANQPLANVTGPFDNGAAGLDFDVTGDPSAFHSTPGTWSWDPGTRTFELLDPPSFDAHLKTTVALRPGDYYVVSLDLDFLGTAEQVLLRAEAADCDWACQRTIGAKTAAGVQTYDVPFLVPADLCAGATSVDVSLDLFPQEDPTGSFAVSRFAIRRMNDGFQNLMVAGPASFGGQTHPGLGIEVLRSNGHAASPSWYVITPYPTQNLAWEMESDGTEFTVMWIGPTQAEPVRVSYTLGVPRDYWNGNATTWCLNNGELLARLEGVMDQLFGTTSSGSLGSYALDPAHVHLKLDEVRGMNRCGRCVARGLANDEYLPTYVDAVRGMLGRVGAADTVLIAWDDMFNPFANGMDVADQHDIWLGQLGKTSGGLGSLLAPELFVLTMWEPVKALTAHAQGWPGTENGALRVVAARGEYSGAEYPAEWWALRETWKEPDVLGFLAYQYAAAPPGAESARLLDYAWRSYRQPKAALHAYTGTAFLTDDVQGLVLSIDSGATLDFAVFGSEETRSVFDCTDAYVATLDYGDGSPPVDVTSWLNRATFSHRFVAGGLHTVTLTLDAVDPCKGGFISYPETWDDDVTTVGIGVEVDGALPGQQ